MSTYSITIVTIRRDLCYFLSSTLFPHFSSSASLPLNGVFDVDELDDTLLIQWQSHGSLRQLFQLAAPVSSHVHRQFRASMSSPGARSIKNLSRREAASEVFDEVLQWGRLMPLDEGQARLQCMRFWSATDRWWQARRSHGQHIEVRRVCMRKPRQGRLTSQATAQVMEGNPDRER